MTVVELLLRALAALRLGDASVLGGVTVLGDVTVLAPAPLLAVAALGLTAVVVAALVVRLLAVALGLDTDPTGGGDPGAAVGLPTRIAWSHPDADGQVRSRAPGAVAPA